MRYSSYLRRAPGVRAHPTRQFEWNRERTNWRAGAACRQRQARSCREDRARQLPRSSLRDNGHRYYGWSYADSVFRFSSVPSTSREQAYEGKYVIQTEEPDLSTDRRSASLQGALGGRAALYQCTKNVLDMRRGLSSRATIACMLHVFVAALAFLLHRAIEERLKTARLDLSATKHSRAPRVRACVDIDLGETAPPERSVHAWHSSAPPQCCAPRLRRPRPIAPRPAAIVVTKRDSRPRKINRLHVN